MIQKVLIPTDFTIESLNTVKYLLNSYPTTTTFDIILFFGFRLPDSTIELMYFSKSRLMDDVSNPEFEEACVYIKKDHVGQIHSLRLDIFTGINMAAFQNYLEANHIERVCVSVKHQLKLPHKRSFNTLPFIYKSGIDIQEVDRSAITEKEYSGGKLI
ncbi:hypothetical protein FNH22_30405 [Fulvivirga sp. M361]|uniref:hypothetical protein n=1 Tax=Fulvivirga sp. M361 TaxID=2594266 RepID=UPI00117BBA6D|nr:hypothetical protein [Fulvivirga sp. M361]TRX47133.1 hypothetical protein FNH22_30405 [Fulvivirga sp. M361]